MTSFPLAGANILITGGTNGMGLATASLLAGAGANIVITGRNEQRLTDAVDLLTARGKGTVHGLRADSARLDDLSRLVHFVDGKLGHLDGVFANAGVGIFKPFAEHDEADFTETFDVNVKGTFFLVQKALPLLQKAPNGASVVINASWTLQRGMAVSSLYSASKAAVHNLARTLASALARDNIRVNSVSPGFIATDMLRAGEDAEVLASLSSQVALGRVGEAAEVAKAVAFLLSFDASYVNAQDLIIDGGLVSAIPAH